MTLKNNSTFNGMISIVPNIVKDVARHGGDVTGMVPDGVVPMLDEALNHERGE